MFYHNDLLTDTLHHDGLLLQWGLSEHGRYNGGQYDARNIYFPISFSGNPLAVIGCQIALDGSSRDEAYFGYLTNTTAAGNPGVAYTSSRFTLAAWNQHDYFWMAIGRA